MSHPDELHAPADVTAGQPVEPTEDELSALIDARLAAVALPNDGACAADDLTDDSPFPAVEYMRFVMSGNATDTPVADLAAARALCGQCQVSAYAACARAAERSTDTTRIMIGMTPAERVEKFATTWVGGTWARYLRASLIKAGVREPVADAFVAAERADLIQRIANLQGPAS